MANLCDIDMHARGTRKHLEQFIDALTQKDNIWIGRGAEVNVSYNDDEDLSNAEIFGYCKWSIVSALIDNAISMRQHPEKWYTGTDKDLTFITLDEASKIYDLDIEAYSNEPGCEFEEHYLIRKGIIEKDECVDYQEYFKCDFDTKEDFEKTYKIEVTDEEWDDDSDYISRGGFKRKFVI